MREIRFAWVCRNIHFNEIERVELTDDMLLDHTWPSWITTDNCEILAKILPTGQKDRNGVEIWEGDLVREPFGAIRQVIWKDGCFFLGDNTFHNYHFDGAPFKVEVVGNIYENENMLDKG